MSLRAYARWIIRLSEIQSQTAEAAISADWSWSMPQMDSSCDLLWMHR